MPACANDKPDCRERPALIWTGGDVRKYSRRYGWMWLRSYAPGDGSVDFVWTKEGDAKGAALDEPVTESDASEWLRIDENSRRWEGWEILQLAGPKGRPEFAPVRLVERVSRPKHTSKKLLFRGDTYEYVWHGEHGGDGQTFTPQNTTFYDAEREAVRNADFILAMCFFLNHESEFEVDGFQTRT